MISSFGWVVAQSTTITTDSSITKAFCTKRSVNGEKGERDSLKTGVCKMGEKPLGRVMSEDEPTPAGATRIRIVCTVKNTFSGPPPLIVIDGIPYRPDSDSVNKYGSKLANLDPNDIETFNIIKESDAIGSMGCRRNSGVIIITTKNANKTKFIIKDFLNGERIAGATVSFISVDKKDTVMLAANDSGVILTNKLKKTVAYNMFVSATGYKLFSTNLNKGNAANKKEILLERNEKTCDEVVVSVIGEVRRCRTGCRATRTIVYPQARQNDLADKSKLKIFPNPVPKGSIFNIETSTESEQALTIKITGLDGKLLLSQSPKAIKGLNRFSVSTDARWVSGIYLVHLYANGQLLASSKLILQ